MTEPSASMRFIADRGYDLLVTCSGKYDGRRGHTVERIPGERAVRLYGAETTLRDLDARYGCKLCGAPVKTEILPASAEPKPWHLPPKRPPE